MALSSIYPRKIKTYVTQKTGNFNFSSIRLTTGAFSVTVKNWKQPRCPSTGDRFNKGG
jgi:hypothetical protein